MSLNTALLLASPAPTLSCDWSPGGRARQPPRVQWTKLGSAELGPGAVTRGDTLRWVSRHVSFKRTFAKFEVV